ncbi:MAG: antitoxin [Eubacteriales bacterium]|nr:antitoxin [Eubacteriales bacterium]
MAISEAQKRAVAKYNAKAYDRIELKVLKGQKEVLQSIAKEQGVSLNGYTKQALQAKIKADTGKDIEL